MRYIKGGNIEFQLDQLLNEGLELGDNLRGGLVEVSLVIGDNEIHHGQGFTPQGYIVIYSEAEELPYGTRVEEWTSELLFLRSSVTNLRVRLFVL